MYHQYLGSLNRLATQINTNKNEKSKMNNMSFLMTHIDEPNPYHYVSVALDLAITTSPYHDIGVALDLAIVVL